MATIVRSNNELNKHVDNDFYDKTALDAGQLDNRYYTETESNALFEPADATILKDADIGVTVQEYDATILKDADIGASVQPYDIDTAKLDVLQTFTASQRGTLTTDNDGSFDMNVTNNFKCTPTATFALTFTNIASQGGTIILDNSGGYVITADTAVKVDANLLSTISTAGVYVLAYQSDGTSVYVTGSLGLA